MELKISDVQLPEIITFNYDELKQEIVAKAKQYEMTVYSEERIKVAKADRATLNKLKKALNDERIRREREYMKPFNDFKNKVNELIDIIASPVLLIDGQIKFFEDKQKEEKRIKIENFFIGFNSYEWLKVEQIFDEKWLNTSVKMPTIEAEIKEKIEQITKDLATLSKLPEFAFEAIEGYKITLDINKAVNEAHRLSETAKKKAAFEKQKKTKAEVQKPPQPIEKEWISFSAYLSVDEALALKEFFDSRNIEFKPI